MANSVEWNAESQIATKVQAWSRRLSYQGFQDAVDAILVV